MTEQERRPSPVLSEDEFRNRLAKVMNRHALARAAGLRIGRPLAVTLTGWKKPDGAP